MRKHLTTEDTEGEETKKSFSSLIITVFSVISVVCF
jgi:hypothetical protein